MNFFPQSEDLAATPTKSTQKAPAPWDREVHGVNREYAHVEVCAKCRGTGTFVGYTGRVFGPCFECKGEGKKFFATSAEHRAQQRQQAADRKTAKAAAAVDAFAAAHPDVAAWLKGNDFEFAVSLSQALAKYGSLTENQLAAARKCIAKRAEAVAARQERVEAAPVVDLTKLELAFTTARQNGLKSPKVRFAGLTISPAKATSANAGALYVKADGAYVGKISGGKFICTRECPAETQQRVVATIADPKAAAIAYGRETGSCSCCGRELSNKESIALGIGPICAEKYGW